MIGNPRLAISVCSIYFDHVRAVEQNKDSHSHYTGGYVIRYRMDSRIGPHVSVTIPELTRYKIPLSWLAIANTCG